MFYIFIYINHCNYLLYIYIFKCIYYISYYVITIQSTVYLGTYNFLSQSYLLFSFTVCRNVDYIRFNNCNSKYFLISSLHYFLILILFTQNNTRLFTRRYLLFKCLKFICIQKYTIQQYKSSITNRINSLTYGGQRLTTFSLFIYIISFRFRPFRWGCVLYANNNCR